MAIRLESPDTRLLSEQEGPGPHHRYRDKLQHARQFLTTRHGRLLIWFLLLWSIAYIYCKHRFWRDPDSWFHSENGIYNFEYSLQRRLEAEAFIATANNTADITTPASTHLPPVICIGMVTVKRKHGVDYLNGTIGSMLMGLSPEERSALDVQLVFADPKPDRHPEWNSTWLHVVDRWSTYNLSDEQFQQIEDWKRNGQIQEKGTL